MIHLYILIAMFKLLILFLCVLPHLIHFECLSCEMIVTIIPSERNCPNSALGLGNVKTTNRCKSHENLFRFCNLTIHSPQLKSIGIVLVLYLFGIRSIPNLTNQLVRTPGSRLFSNLSYCIQTQFFSSP